MIMIRYIILYIIMIIYYDYVVMIVLCDYIIMNVCYIIISYTNVIRRRI